MHTDACQLAAGAFFRGDWVYINFGMDSSHLAHLHINYKEVLAQILRAAFRWAKDWQNQHVVIYCDNETAVHIINKGSTTDPTIMQALRQLFWLSAVYDFRFTEVPIKGRLNTTADALSRRHEQDKCIAFYNILSHEQPKVKIDHARLLNHTYANSMDFLFNRFA